MNIRTTWKCLLYLRIMLNELLIYNNTLLLNQRVKINFWCVNDWNCLKSWIYLVLRNLKILLCISLNLLTSESVCNKSSWHNIYLRLNFLNNRFHFSRYLNLSILLFRRNNRNFFLYNHLF